MFVSKSPQESFFDNIFWMPPEVLERLEKSWAGVFREHILPLLIESEKQFSFLYSPNMGAPCKNVAEIIGLLILKEMNDLTDKEILEHLQFDLQWQYALDTSLDQAFVSERTIFYFRKRIIENDQVCALFKNLIDRIIETWSIRTGKHRFDSTVIMSNMKKLNRLGLFIRTIESFLKDLKKNKKGSYRSLPEHFKKRYMEREGYFAYPKPLEARRNLEQCALDLCELVNRFRGCGKVRNWKTYKDMERLLNDQVVISEDDSGHVTIWFHEPKKVKECKDPRGEVALKSPKDIGGDTLQNPSDPDATYSGHKGPGYKVQLSETCDKENPFQVIDFVKLEKAYESDQNSAEEIHADLKERGHEPKTTYADSGYVSGENIVKARNEGIDLKGPLPGKEPKEEKEIIVGDFQFDDTFKEVKICPGGQKPVSCSYDEETETLEAAFDIRNCKECPHTKDCPARKNSSLRVLRIDRNNAATSFRRREQKTKEFKEEYKIRSGMESTNSHLKNDRGMGRLRVRGSPSVTLRVVFKVIGENISRTVKYILKSTKKALKSPNTALA
jgi:hypothetical protein